MKNINEDFIKDTATMFADMQSDDIKLNYKDGVYYGYIEGFKKALEVVKNNGVLDGVSNRRELLIAFYANQNGGLNNTNKYSIEREVDKYLSNL